MIKGDFECPLRRDCTTSDLRDAAEDRGVEISRATDIANADGDIFEDDKASLVPQRLSIDSPLADGSGTVLARKIIHVRRLT